jgi:Protein of unknown function (DUF2442)
MMNWQVTKVQPLSDGQIYVEIKNGATGIFDVKPYMNRGILQELQNKHYFNQVYIFLGAVTWPNGQDIAPETLLKKMEACEPMKSNEDIPQTP